MLGGCMQETLAPATQAGWSARDKALMSNLPYAQATIPDEFRRHIVGLNPHVKRERDQPLHRRQGRDNRRCPRANLMVTRSTTGWPQRLNRPFEKYWRVYIQHMRATRCRLFYPCGIRCLIEIN